MTRSRYALPIVLLLALASAAVALALRVPAGSAFAGMPAAPAAHWAWVATSQPATAETVEAGLALVARQPEFGWTYLRLADACVEADLAASCRTALGAAAPATAEARAYRAVPV